MNAILETNAAVNTFRPSSSLTPIGTVIADILTDAVLAAVFSLASCSVCDAVGEPTVGPTYRDPETGGQFCLLCLELSCKPFGDE